MINHILILIAGLVILITGGELLVRGSTSIALKAKISPLVVGLTIVAFGTSAPELLISVQAALRGSPDMSMGNVVGSNICNLALVLGVTALINPIPVNSDSVKIDWPVAMGSSLFLYFLMKYGDHELDWKEGIIFLIIIAAYTYFIISRSRKETIAMENGNKTVPPPVSPKTLARDLLLIVLGCVGLYFGADWFVGGASDMASVLGVSDRVIGITVLAVGTSLPELVTAVMASVKGESDLAVGNLIGSNIFNILSILGITSIITTISVSREIVNYDMLAMICVTLLILPLMLYKRNLGRIAGGVLLVAYIFYTYTVVS